MSTTLDLRDLRAPLPELVAGVADGLRLFGARDRASDAALFAAANAVVALDRTPAGRAALRRLGGARRVGARVVHPRTCAAFLRWAHAAL